MLQSHVDVAIIGAGPSGACAAKLLKMRGLSVVVLEKERFPRFSIGESLLPQCMSFLDEAGLLDAVEQHGFQYKNGAAFLKGGKYTVFDFSEKVSAGPSTTFQVKRADFDKLLADQAEAAGIEFRYQHQVSSYSDNGDHVALEVQDLSKDEAYTLTTRFVLDASGFGRVLPRLLDLEYPSDFPVRQAVFTHFKDNLPQSVDRNKILITVHPTIPDIWFWLIPFSDGTSSIGVVGEQSQFSDMASLSNDEILLEFIRQTPDLQTLLKDASIIAPARNIVGYSANVKTLFGDKFALLGNAGEFLDPVFSSGVTIALKSATLAAPLVVRQLAGEKVDWQVDYSDSLRSGISTFWHFVSRWYNQELQNIIFYDDPQPKVKQMICAVLAGYAWDESNPFVKDSERRLAVLSEICAP